MIQNISDYKQVIIGVDHGYGNTKTAHRLFRSGAYKLQTEAIAGDNVLVYKGVSYAIGESHITYAIDRTEDEETHIITLAAIGEELLERGFTTANVVLGVGLPLARYALLKGDFKKYMLHDADPEFDYKDHHFKIHISEVYVFPQGLAETCTIEDLSDENLIIDIGNGTMNIAKIVDGVPVEKELSTERYGVSILVGEIQKALARSQGRDISDSIIEKLLTNGIDGRTDEIARVTDELARKYAAEIVKKIGSYGYVEGYVKLHIFGGGGCLLRNYSELGDKHGIFFHDDICANAKGYEALARMKLEAKRSKKNAS